MAILTTPEVANKNQIIGGFGLLVGLILILITFILRKQYVFTVAIFFGIYLQINQLIQLFGQRKIMKKLKQDFISLEEEKQC